MAKQLLTNCKVTVGSTDLSEHAFSLDSPAEKDQVEVTGFNPTRTREFLQGLEDQTIEVGFLQDFGSGSVHATLYPIFSGGSTVVVKIQPDATAGISATNPWYGGTAQLFTYNGLSGTLNDRAEITATFKPATGASFAWNNS